MANAVIEWDGRGSAMRIIAPGWDHVHTTDGRCRKDRYGGCTAPRATDGLEVER